MTFYTDAQAGKEDAMKQLSIKPGDSIVVDGFDGDVILTFDRLNSLSAELTVNAPEDISVKHGKKAKPEPEPDADIQRDLENSMGNVISLLAEMDSAVSQEILTKFVSDLFYTQAKKRQKEERQVRQTEGIAAARERGVKFGRARKPLPEGFEEYREAWRGGQMTLRQAAKDCGMNHSTFRSAVLRMESDGQS